jgi:hypothetical protein
MVTISETWMSGTRPFQYNVPRRAAGPPPTPAQNWK